ncbi:MAG TPA: hypothetical protein PK681_11775 [Steroidobacteraceae bacterium]|nr:hypothetical protein [Steroidobacteraceae bacterium]HQX47021.1 hypothetical protein [Steroidobacteraceae bacterium]HQX79644.1 hypothetical protein [Steroidobacteraceae bacterium]HQZ81288.1 hypothetical protein [Steroidobacteraceae bacterium]
MRNCLIVLFAAAALAGCKTSGGGCGKPPEYTNSDSIAPLAVPPGMDAPNTRGALRVPELETPERPRGPNEPCLDQPPKYVPPQKPAPTPQA